MSSTPSAAAEPTVFCPKCRHEFKLTESLVGPLLEAERRTLEVKIKRELAAAGDDERKRLEDELKEQRAKVEAALEREREIGRRERALRDEKERLDLDVESRVQAERDRIAAKAREAAEREAAEKSRDLQEALADRTRKLDEARKAELDVRRRADQLEEAQKAFEVEKVRAIAAAKQEIQERAVQEAVEAFRQKDLEKEQKIKDLVAKLDDAKRRAEQGSQQLQGEVLELDFETRLRALFPCDLVEPVPKGEFGGDLVHRVFEPAGVACGAILWETKCTKNWSDGWLPKLRDDLRAAKADVALLVSVALPKGIELFGRVDGVWIAAPKVALALAGLLRHGLTDVASAVRAGQGRHTKVEQMYDYLLGPRFKQHVEAILEAFGTMQRDLDAERRAIERSWAKRDKQIERALNATVHLYGDLQGIAGNALPQIPSLEIESLGVDADAELRS
jgi:hypothetical protein